MVEPKGGATARGLSGLWSTTGAAAVDSAKALWDLIQYSAPGSGQKQDLDPNTKAIVSNAKAASKDQWRKAGEARDRGDYVEALGHLLGSVPIVGTAAAHAGERIGGSKPVFDKYGNVIQSGTTQDIAGGIGEGLGMIFPSVAHMTTPLVKAQIAKMMPKGKMAAAGASLEQVTQQAGHLPIDVQTPGHFAMEGDRLAKSGSSMPKVLNDFIKRVTDPKKPPLTFKEAREFYSNASALSVDEMNRLNPRMKRAVGNFRESLHQSLTQTADQVGLGDFYQDAIQRYGKAAKWQGFYEDVKTAVKKDAWKWALKGGLGGATAYEAWKHLWGKAEGGTILDRQPSREQVLNSLRGYADGGVTGDDGLIHLGDRPGEFGNVPVKPRPKEAVPPKPAPRFQFQDPINQYLSGSAEQMVGGWHKLWDPSDTTAADPNWWNTKAQGASDVVRGSAPFLAPLAIPAAAAAPIPTLTGLAAGVAVTPQAEKLATKAGMPPGYASLYGDLTGLGTGIMAPQVAPALARGAVQAPGAIQDVINRLDYTGGDPERGSISRKPVKPKQPPGPAVPSVGTLMEKPLEVPGKGVTSDLGQVLQDTVSSKNRLDPIRRGMPDWEIDLRRQRAIGQMQEDVRYGMDHSGDARDWYTKMVEEMEGHLQQNRPEFGDPNKRSLFKYLLGITSNGVDPEINFGAALKGWDMYLRDGKFSAYDPTQQSEFGNPKGLGLTFRANSYEGAMQRLNQLVQDKGEAGAVEWLKSKHPVKELREYYPNLKGKASDQRLGAYVFGEKVGAFGSNLNGIHSELTADKWWSRTWNRWMGTIMATDAQGNPIVDEETGMPALQDAPRNETERNLMRETAGKVAGDLGLSVDELQAVLWYTELSLYRAHGVDASSIGYGEAARKYFSRGAIQPAANAADRGPAAGTRANAKPGATQRSAPKAPRRIPKASQVSAPPEEVIPGGRRGGLAAAFAYGRR